MSIPLTEVVYPLDETGISPANKIQNERHQLTTAAWDGFNIVIPLAAPFYDDSITHLIHYPSGDRLERGRDWITGWLFQSATGEIGQNISSCIYLFNNNLSGHVEIPSYQCLGGEHQLSREKLVAILAEKLLNPQRYYWEFVANLPQIYRPLDHDQDIDTFTELGELLDALREITQAIRDTPWASMFQAHLIEHNPHDINKDDVELGNVQNWLFAALSDIADLNNLPSNRYVGLPIVKEMIERIAMSALNNFAARRDNPNEVSWEQTGAVNDAAVRQIIADVMTGGIGAIDAATLNGINSNQIVQNAVTAMEDELETTRDFMLAQLQSILQGFQAEDTQRFSGKNEGEWDLRIVNFFRTLSSTRRFNAVMTIVETPGSGAINSVTATEPTTTLIATLEAVAIPARNSPVKISVVTGSGTPFLADVIINANQGTGFINVFGDVPAGWLFFIDRDNENRRRLWVTAPANRPALDIFVHTSTGLIVGDGLTFYGASSTNQWSHASRVDLPVILYATTDNVTAGANAAVATANSYTNQTASGLRSEISTAKSEAVTAANQNTASQISGVNTSLSSALAVALLGALSINIAESRITIPANGSVTFGDDLFINALNSQAVWGSSYQTTTGTASTWWNNKPHDPNTIQANVMVKFGGNWVNLSDPNDITVTIRSEENARAKLNNRVVISNNTTGSIEVWVVFNIGQNLPAIQP